VLGGPDWRRTVVYSQTLKGQETDSSSPNLLGFFRGLKLKMEIPAKLEINYEH
jgi:hypothetical protein